MVEGFIVTPVTHELQIWKFGDFDTSGLPYIWVLVTLVHIGDTGVPEMVVTV
jgi:hypothetical protein